MKFCRFCGHQVPDAAAFCVHCGKGLPEPQTPPADLALVETAYAAPQAPAAGAEAAAIPPAPASATPSTPPPRLEPEAGRETAAWLAATLPDAAPPGPGAAPPPAIPGLISGPRGALAIAAPSVLERPTGPPAPRVAPSSRPATPSPAAPARAGSPEGRERASPSRAPVAEEIPFDRGLRVSGIVLGLLLLAYFFIPVGEEQVFLWERIQHGSLSDLHFMRWLYPAGMGLLLVILGLIPLPASVRGSLYAALGVAPLVYFIVQAKALVPGFEPFVTAGKIPAALEGARGDLVWRSQVLAGALFLLPFAHFLRARRWRSVAARLLVGLGAAGLLCIYLLPLDVAALEGVGRLPVVALFEGLRGGDVPGYVMGALVALPLLLGMFSFMAFAGTRSAGGGDVLATLFLVWVPLVFAAPIVIGVIRGASPAVLLEAGRLLVYSFCCQFFVAYGFVHVFPETARRP